MNTASVLFRTEPEIKTKAQKIANELGISLSVVLNGFLREFVKTKTVTFTTEELTPYAKEGIKKAKKSFIKQKHNRLYPPVGT
ncbi:type II toxin-antitoxin system RelB/DinJ family antitoxin [Patescibacteria group bacterium]|nr:type II toxin-antitoxin system RelB/DinJ family antitoxin [Patescibacteria group bacterium]MCL5010260.1 type II toxin-antitoxin system RelB/DinJ family antitoxin [Patescibacteria group bacterium]